MPTLELLRTTSFRLAVLFLTLFGGVSLLLFGFVYLQTQNHLVGEVDDWLDREQAGMTHESSHRLQERLAEHLMLDHDALRPFSLLDGEGHVIAGSPIVPPLPFPLDEPFEFATARNGETIPFRSLAHQFPTGNILLVSEDMRDLNRFRDRITDAMTWGWLLALAVGLAGAAIIGVSALRRIEAVTRAIERIVMGDLSERLPVHTPLSDIDRLSAIVNRMLDDIQRLMGEVKGVTDDIAHDLRTPLTRLLAGLDRARRRANTPEEYAVAVDEAIVETQGLLRTFSAMLRISEVEDSARRAGFGMVNLSEILVDVADLYGPVAEEKAVILSLEDASGKPVMLSGDSSLLFEAIGNLVDNAIKYTPIGGCVTLRTWRTNRRMGVTVSDTGPGIPAAERDAVLRRFYRVEKSRHTPGSGLGLSLVAAIARLHGLSITIADANPGCSITLSGDAVPMARPAAPAQTAAASVPHARALSS